MTMSGIFERLQKQMEAGAEKEGLSPLDLQGLPPLMRKVMRYMLREYEMSYIEIRAWAAELPEAERPSEANLDEALETLSKQFWLIKRGEGDRVRYQANLRRKAASRLDQSAWNSLDAKIAAAKKPPQK
jgi:hypothetical protein